MEIPALSPLIRSLAAPAGSKMLPARSHGVVAPAEHFATEDNMSDRGNPYVWGAPGRYDVYAGQMYGPIPQQDNARAMPIDPNAPRAAFGTAFVTPPELWNLSGVSSGWSNPGAPNPVQPVRAKLAFGALGSLLARGPQLQPPLPTLPEPARMVAPGF